jgi:hypothetical protein
MRATLLLLLACRDPWTEAEKADTVAAYDAFLERFPQGKVHDELEKEREKVAFDEADAAGTPEAWESWRERYRASGDKRLRRAAKGRLEVARHKDHIEVGPTTMEQVNLAENPDGPLDGWGFWADVTNRGTEPMTYLVLRIDYLDEAGKALDGREWPAVATALPGGMPIPDGFDKPMQPGEKRTWEWTTGDMPAGWAKKVAVKAVDVRFSAAVAAE